MRHELTRQGRLVTQRELLELSQNGHPCADSGPTSPVAPERRLVSRTVVAAIVRFSEMLIVLAVGVVVWALYVRDFSASAVSHYLPVIVAASYALPTILQLGGLYSMHALIQAVEQVARVALAWVALFAVILTLVVFTRTGEEFSRVWLLSWFAAGLGSLVLFRMSVSFLVRHWSGKGQLDRQAVLVGGGAPAEDLISALRGSPYTDVSIIGIFDDRGEERSPAAVSGARKLGNVDELVDFARLRRVDLLIVTLPLTAENRVLQLLKKLWVLPVDIRLSAYTQKLRYRPRAYSYIGNVPFLDVTDKPISDWNAVIKAVEDRTLAAAALLLLSPVMLLVALAIMLDSRGPVLFRQRRYGFNNELIEVYKFRSMYADRTDANAQTLVTRGDSRVTRVGRFIRKTSLDELPQLLNVLKGDLSLVGPRPHATHAKAQNRLYGEVVDGYFARHKVKPGITGWAQVNGWRGETDTEEKIERRVEHDLYYIENWSILLDLYILLRTPFALCKTEQAY